MKFILNIALLCSLPLSAQSTEPTAEFRGVGRIDAKPDFVKIDITVRSECYDTPALAQEETDKTVKKIHDYLQKQKVQKITINGGYSAPFSRWSKNEELCRNTFQKDTQITVEIAATADFNQDFAHLQTYVLKKFKRGLSLDEQGPLTFVEIAVPSPGLVRKHREELMAQARNLALLDAKKNFMAAIRSCKKHQWKVISIKEASPSFAMPMARGFSYSTEARGAPAPVIAPVRFDDLKVEVQFDVTFGFDGALCYEGDITKDHAQDNYHLKS